MVAESNAPASDELLSSPDRSLQGQAWSRMNLISWSKTVVLPCVYAEGQQRDAPDPSWKPVVDPLHRLEMIQVGNERAPCPFVPVNRHLEPLGVEVDAVVGGHPSKAKKCQPVGCNLGESSTIRSRYRAQDSSLADLPIHPACDEPLLLRRRRLGEPVALPRSDCLNDAPTRDQPFAMQGCRVALLRLRLG